jgi:hypothetical protein
MTASASISAVADRRLEAMRRHIAALLERLGPDVSVFWIAWPDQAHIRRRGGKVVEVHIPRIRSDVTYMIALHELGHIFGERQQPNSYDRITRERWASRWARKNAIIWSSVMAREDARSLRTYTENTPPGAVAILFTAINAEARGDRTRLASARGELLALAHASDGFTAQLTAAVVETLLAKLPDVPREEIARAAAIDVDRHLGQALRLAAVEPWGSA